MASGQEGHLAWEAKHASAIVWNVADVQLIAQVIAQAQESWLGNGLVLIDGKLLPEADVPAYRARALARLTPRSTPRGGIVAQIKASRRACAYSSRCLVSVRSVVD